MSTVIQCIVHCMIVKYFACISEYLHYRPDKTMQALVYKLVPGLQKGQQYNNLVYILCRLLDYNCDLFLFVLEWVIFEVITLHYVNII